MIEKYENINEDDLIKLLYTNNNVMTEIILINLYNTINKIPLIKDIKQFMKFKYYVNLCKELVITFPELSKDIPLPLFNDLEIIKKFLKEYYNIIEVYKNNNLINIIIKEKIYEIR